MCVGAGLCVNYFTAPVTAYAVKILDGLKCSGLAACEIISPISCKLFNFERMHYSLLKPRTLTGLCLAGEDCLFLIEIISQWEKSCPCEESDSLLNAPECRGGEGGWNTTFLCCSLLNKANSSERDSWRLITTSALFALVTPSTKCDLLLALLQRAMLDSHTSFAFSA